jgi:hypothetical protein
LCFTRSTRSMMTLTRRYLIALPWLALPLLLGSYLLLWDKLPAVLAVQFDSNGNPTNTMRKGLALALECALLLFVLLKYSLRLWDGERHQSRLELVVDYIAVLLMSGVFQIILRFNL